MRPALLLLLACLWSPTLALADDPLCVRDDSRDSTQQIRTPTRKWYACDNGESYCEVVDKRDYAPPDKPIWLSLAYEAAFMPQQAPRLLARNDWVPRLRAGAGVDLWASKRWAAGPELAYAIDGQSEDRLFGGAVQSEVVVHAITLSAVLRYMLSDCSNPPWEAFARVFGGVELGFLELRDAPSDSRRSAMDSSGPFGFGVGVIWRRTGLGFELGLRATTSDLQLGDDDSERPEPRMARVGPYSRISLTVRVP